MKTLDKLSQLFPERQIETDYDATRLIEELGDNASTELQSRMKSKDAKAEKDSDLTS